MSEELFEWQGMRNIRVLAHLLIYWGADEVPVCVVGTFDGAAGSASSSPEIVSTAVAARLDRDAFRLFSWDPRDGRQPFCEITVTPTEPTKLQRDELVIRDKSEAEMTTSHRDAVVVRFLDPQWNSLSEDQMAEVLGEAAIRDLRSYAGLPGEYRPERLFGESGEQLAEQLQAHNDQIAAALKAQVGEWSVEP
jgi:hypothetical protein